MIKSFILVTRLLSNMLLVFCPHIDLISCLCVCVSVCVPFQRVFWRLWVFVSLLTRGSDYLCISSAGEVEKHTISLFDSWLLWKLRGWRTPTHKRCATSLTCYRVNVNECHIACVPNQLSLPCFSCAVQTFSFPVTNSQKNKS